MMKKISALLAALVLTLAFATTCFAAPSPTVTDIPTQDTTKGGNVSPTSPKTGLPIAGAFVAVISSAGLALVAKKEME